MPAETAAFPPGRSESLAPGLRRVLAPNPSPMTFLGTNTYILGEGEVAVIDPGPALDGHVAAILAALAPGETIGQILVTHAHLDHSPAARPLAALCGAPVFAFGPALAGRSPLMSALAALDEIGGGEGVDHAFRPDETLGDGAVIEAGGLRVEALHTPGHFGNHLCFAVGDWLFSGDHVMGWASSLVSPPDGDMTDYMASLERLAARPERRYLPGHGAEIADGPARVADLARHRRQREAEIRAALEPRPADAATIARMVYRDTPPALLRAAERNVFAHLVDLMARNLAVPLDPISAGATFRLL